MTTSSALDGMVHHLVGTMIANIATTVSAEISQAITFLAQRMSILLRTIVVDIG
jgi:hypothetical protein